MARFTIEELEVEKPKEGLEIEMDDGTVYLLQDPKALPLATLMSLEGLSRMQQVRAVIANGKWDEFSSRPEVDGYLFDAVMKTFSRHYGLGSLGEGDASLRSVSGTARPSKSTSKKPAKTSGRSGRAVSSAIS